MQTTRMRALVAIAIVVGVLCCDQLIKLWVKMNMCLYESIHVADWFYIYFTENKGMAFGMDFIGTMFLSVFRIVSNGIACLRGVARSRCVGQHYRQLFLRSYL